MKLSDWLHENRVSRSEFAERIGMSPAMVTQMCADDVWPGPETFEKIITETKGEVTPNDFLEARNLKHARAL
jgi:3,4-dihydroxy 2-butanone 4-phosphate synthase / GTP cyclohydrolase II